MKNFLTMENLLMLWVLPVLSLHVANASLVPCLIGGADSGVDDPVVNTTVITCGSLVFSNFDVPNFTGGTSGLVDILGGTDYDSETGAAYLNFNPNLVGATQYTQLMFEVTGGVGQIGMSLGGDNASVTERACANPVPLAGPLALLCTDPTGTIYEAPLGLITVASDAAAQPVFSAPFPNTSPVYVFDDIQTGAAGQLGQFTQIFDGSAVPEPLTTVLLGSGLLILGLLRRRVRAT
ncbi:MAG: PEP-CTERM sorting domain-containing protein [Bryobacteraceae bacterium]|jgi:hypothetical protein